MDIRLTTKDGVSYAFCLGIPTEDILIRSLEKSTSFQINRLTQLKMIGNDINQVESNRGWNYNKKTIKVPGWQVQGFKIEFKK